MDDNFGEFNQDSNEVKIPIQWLKVRAIMEEICEVVFSFGGLTLTALIALGILPWGVLGIGICATLAFIGITRFIATNSWSYFHNNYNDDNRFYRSRNSNSMLLIVLKIGVIPGISLIAGAILTALGATGIFSLSLGLSLGIPLLGAFVVGVITYITQSRFVSKHIEDSSLFFLAKDNLWGMCMGIFALVATAIFLGLGFGGILALPTAIALAAPLCILAVGIGLLTLFAWSVNIYGPEKLKNYLKNNDGEISCLGFGYFKDKSHNLEQKQDENELLISKDEESILTVTFGY